MSKERAALSRVGSKEYTVEGYRTINVLSDGMMRAGSTCHELKSDCIEGEDFHWVN